MKKLFYSSLFMLTTCGTIFCGTTQEMQFDSNVPDVAIFIDGHKVCETPCTTEVPKEKHRLLITAKRPVTKKPNKHFTGYAAGTTKQLQFQKVEPLKVLSYRFFI